MMCRVFGIICGKMDVIGANDCVCFGNIKIISHLCIITPFFDMITVITHIMIWNTLCYTKWIFAHIQNTRFKLIKWVWVLFDFAIFTDVMQLTAVLISQPSRWNPWYDIPVVNKSVHFMRVIKFFCPATPPRFPTLDGCFPTTHECFPTLDDVSTRSMGVSIHSMVFPYTRWCLPKRTRTRGTRSFVVSVDLDMGYILQEILKIYKNFFYFRILEKS